MVTTAPGIHATTTLNHIDQTSFLKILPFLLIPSTVSFFLKGHILFQNNTTTAKMAPNCITYINISLKFGLTSSLINSSTKSICPVLLIGSHSVIPSTIPRNITFKILIKLNIFNLPFL